MTQLEYTHTPHYFAITFRGHAGYAPVGRDIVCAAVSILASELLYACEQAAAAGEITDYAHSEGSAFADVRFYYRRTGSMRQIVKLILVSLKMLEAEYGDYVQLKEAQAPSTLSNSNKKSKRAGLQ